MQRAHIVLSVAFVFAAASLTPAFVWCASDCHAPAQSVHQDCCPETASSTPQAEAAQPTPCHCNHQQSHALVTDTHHRVSVEYQSSITADKITESAWQPIVAHALRASPQSTAPPGGMLYLLHQAFLI